MDDILASIRRILAEDDNAVMRPSSRARANGDVLDLTEAISDDGRVRHIPPIALTTPERPRLPGGRIEPVAPLHPRDAAAEPQLVSTSASDAIAASFARLASLPSPEDGEHSLDELVRETLRPLLQTWLDRHLPELVERLVRAEIARVVGAVRPAAP